MLKELSFITLTKALNEVLQSDPFALDQLEALNHKTLRVIINKTPFDVLILFHPNFIEVVPFEGQSQPTVTLSGAPSSLIKFAKTHEHTRLLMGKNIKIEGELGVLIDVKKFQEHLDIDWEAFLANYLGDFVANRLMVVGKSIGKKIAYQLRRTRHNVADYLQHEAQLLVKREEMNQFSQDMLQLRRSIDRAEARLRILEKQKTH